MKTIAVAEKGQVKLADVKDYEDADKLGCCGKWFNGEWLNNKMPLNICGHVFTPTARLVRNGTLAVIAGSVGALFYAMYMSSGENDPYAYYFDDEAVYHWPT